MVSLLIAIILITVANSKQYFLLAAYNNSLLYCVQVREMSHGGQVKDLICTNSMCALTN